MSEPEEGRFRRSSSRSIDDDLMDDPNSDAAVPAVALALAVPYPSAADLGYSTCRSSSYRAKPVSHSKAHESLYSKNRASAPYQGSSFDGSFASAYGTDGAANHALSVYASAKQANPYR